MALESREAPAVLTVNSVADTANSTDAYLSLREAIAIVDSSTLPSGLSPQIMAQISGTLHAGGSDTIQFDHSQVTGPITLTGDRLPLNLPNSTAAITIDGGATGVTINRFNGAGSQLVVYAGTQATLNHLTITGGYLNGGAGGGIYNAGTLTIANSTVTANQANIGLGGGAYNVGTLTVTNSTFSDNSCDYSTGGGGAIENASGTLIVSGSTFSGNHADNGRYGGAIFNVATAWISGSAFTGNHADTTSTSPAAQSSAGGAIYNGFNGSESMTVLGCTFTNNHSNNTTGNPSSAIGGGAINNVATLTLTNSTLTANTASHTFDGGGGILNAGTLTVTSCTLSGNDAANSVGLNAGGGGINNFGTLVVSNSTFDGNSADGTRNGGGAIYNNGGTATLTSSTLTANHALTSGSANFDGGGGIDGADGGTITLVNTVVAQNTTDATGPDIVGAVVGTSHHNLIGNGSGMSGISNGANGNLVGTAGSPIDPQLSSLANKGGPTQTRSPQAGSPVLDVGDPAQLGTTDQRGVVRLNAVNIGAYQASATSFSFDIQGQATAGASLGFILVAVDPFGQIAVGYRGPVHFTSTDPQATLPADYTFTAADSGVRGFSGTIFLTAGSQTLTASNGAVGAINEFTIPTANSQPTGITAGPDGNVWFVEQLGKKIGRITPSGTITEFPIPSSISGPYGITAGPDGNVWFVEQYGNRVGKITPAGTITEYTVPTAGSQPTGITAGPDGNLWFVEYSGNKVGRITPSGTITEFPIPTGGSNSYNITAGPDGNLWFAEDSGNKIGRITPFGAVTEFPIPTAGGNPYDITAGLDGNLWFTEISVNKVARITPAGAVTEFPIPSPGGLALSPQGITVGADGNIWFTEGNLPGNKVGRITPSGAITEFPIPTDGSLPYDIAASTDGNLWFVENAANKIGRLNSAVPNGSATLTVIAAPPPPTVLSVVINGGAAQRSEVRSIAVTISGAVTFAGGDANAAAAFQLTHAQTGNNVILSAAVFTDGQGNTVVILGFSGGETDPISALNGGVASLADGRYTLTVFASQVTANGTTLDGNGDGTTGDNYVSPADAYQGNGLHLYRLFGDVNGDGVDDATDVGQLKSTFNRNNTDPLYISFLDADNSGAVDAQDISQFKARFNVNVFG
jgi:streptogramin lyase